MKTSLVTNKYAIQVFPGEITYGIYKNSYWYGLYSINNPIYKWVIQRIKNETPNQDIFDICVSGGILENWFTWDVDLFLFGPYEPKKIRESLDTMVRIGFEEHLYIDVVWAEKLWPIHKPDEWEMEFYSYELSNEWARDGNYRDLSDRELVDGLYRRVTKFPFNKHIRNHEKGYRYKKPIFL